MNVTASESSDAWIVEVEVAPANVVLMQSLAQGEEGMATVRCMDPERQRQQFWTTGAQLEELEAWLGSLPESLGVKVTGRWRWQPKGEKTDEQ